jgi:hypothetical protein
VLRRKVEALEGIQALLLTFGEIDPDTQIGDPVAIGDSVTVGEHGRRLPVVESTGRGDTLA